MSFLFRRVIGSRQISFDCMSGNPTWNIMKIWIIESMYGNHKILTETSGDVEGKHEFISEIHKRKSFGWALIPNIDFLIGTPPP